MTDAVRIREVTVATGCAFARFLTAAPRARRLEFAMPIPTAQRREAVVSAENFVAELNKLEDTQDARHSTLLAARTLLAAVQGIINRLSRTSR
jgi:hypothetical protein